MFGQKRAKGSKLLQESSEFSYIRYIIEKALENCSDDIKDLITDFLNKRGGQKTELLDGGIILEIQNISSLVCDIAKNTARGEKISPEDLRYIGAIFKEIEILLMQSLNSETSIRSKIDCLSDFFKKNAEHMKVSGYDFQGEFLFFSKKGMIFESYKNLLIIMHTINEHYVQLEQRGLRSHNMINQFMEIMRNSNISEDKKLNLFMGLLNGTMKIQPVFEYRLSGNQIVPIDAVGPYITNQSALERKEVALQANDASVPIGLDDIESIMKKIGNYPQLKK